MVNKLLDPDLASQSPYFKKTDDEVIFRGENLTINDVIRLAWYHAKVELGRRRRPNLFRWYCIEH
ncbi:MAG: hypothetical protein LWX55_15010 [Deltaproteobacteria bacterium]|jgi:hypothetical protein|nr:hypothetical protein [Deltaproteobacteria bacterium]